MSDTANPTSSYARYGAPINAGLTFQGYVDAAGAARDAAQGWSDAAHTAAVSAATSGVSALGSKTAAAQSATDAQSALSAALLASAGFSAQVTSASTSAANAASSATFAANAAVQATTSAAAAASSALLASTPNIAGTANFGLNTGGATGVVIGGGAADNLGIGGRFRSDGHANWTVLSTTLNENPTELGIYNTAGIGNATMLSGTNQVVRTNGSPFVSRWIGTSFYIGGVRYLVGSVTDSDHLTVTTTGGGAVSFATTKASTYHRVDTSATGICSTNGTIVTRVSGQPLPPFAGTITIAGVSYTIASWQSGDQITLTGSAGVQNGVAFSLSFNVFDQLSTIRVQKMLGANEENLTIAARATGEYIISAFTSGNGYAYPIRMSSGYTGGLPQYLMTIHPGSTGNAGDGYVVLGGYDGAEALRANRTASVVNRFEVNGGPTTFGPSLRSRGADTNVPMGIDTQGTGDVVFTSGSFGAEQFRILGSATTAVNRLSTGGTASGFRPGFRARGSDTNVGMSFDTQGTGDFLFTGNAFTNIAFQVQPVTGGANYLRSSGTLTTVAPSLSAQGTDTNISLSLQPKGTGNVACTGPLKVPGYTFAAQPSAATYTDCIIRLTDRSNRLAVSDGTNWRFMDGVITS